MRLGAIKINAEALIVLALKMPDSITNCVLDA